MHQFFLLLLVSLPLVCTEEGYQSTEETERSQEEFEAAQALAQIFNTSIEQIAQKNNIAPEKVVDAFLWVQEHPETPMPSTPLNYTAQDITHAAENYFKAKDKNLAALKALNKEQIMRDTGATLPDIKKAFAYYRAYPSGTLPVTLERIQELAKKQQDRLNRAKIKYDPEKARANYLKKKNKGMPQAQQAAKKQTPVKGKEKAVFKEEGN